MVISRLDSINAMLLIKLDRIMPKIAKLLQQTNKISLRCLLLNFKAEEVRREVGSIFNGQITLKKLIRIKPKLCISQWQCYKTRMKKGNHRIKFNIKTKIAFIYSRKENLSKTEYLSTKKDIINYLYSIAMLLRFESIAPEYRATQFLRDLQSIQG